MKVSTQDKKRGVKFAVINLSSEFFLDLLFKIRENPIEYKTQPGIYHDRDAALMALLTLTGCRASEIVLLKKEQFVQDGELVRVHKVRTIKGGDLREKIPLPTRRTLGKFTRLIMNWIRQLPDGAYVFPRGSGAGINYQDHISRRRVYQIVYGITGLYPHYFRAVCATLYAGIFKDAWELKTFFGWKNLNSSSPYVKSRWEDKERLINEVF